MQRTYLLKTNVKMNLLLTILAAVGVAFLLAYLIVKFIPLKMRWLVSILLLAATVFYAYKIYESVMKPINFDRNKKVRYAKVIDRLKIIRDAEIKFNERYQRYTADKDSLIDFIKNGKLPIIRVSNEPKVVELGGGITKTISVRKVDTTGYEEVKKYFKNVDYENMFKVPTPNPDSKKEFTLKIGEVEKIKDVLVPVFEARTDKESVLEGMDKDLIEEEKKAITTDEIKGADIYVGSLDDVTTGGNWPPFYDQREALAKKKDNE